MAQVDLLDLTTKLMRIRGSIQRSYSGIVFSGPLANSALDDHTPIFKTVLDSLDTESERVFIEGRDAPEG
ncbi:MAG: hypothetical protein ACK6A7_12880, partial [Planctomycetota bacterium]